MKRDGTPLADIPCHLEPMDVSSMETQRRGATDANGIWRQRGLFPGEYRMISTLPDGQHITVVIRIRENCVTHESRVVDQEETLFTHRDFSRCAT